MERLRRSLTRVLSGAIGLAMAACGQFPEPAAEQPRLTAWVAERYQSQLVAAEIVKINSYSDKFEQPIYVALRDNVPIYFPYAKEKPLVKFVVEMRDGKPVVKNDGFSEESYGRVTDTMAWVIEEAIRRAQTHNDARDKARQSG